jgi:hypothetical protein
MSTVYHEQYSDLSPQAIDAHRALASLIEELEAVDWYNQRADVTGDESLKAILLHNRNEEIEHAAMALEWLRRRIPEFDEQLRTYLFTEAPITEVEEQGEEGSGSQAESKDLGVGKFKKGD